MTPLLTALQPPFSLEMRDESTEAEEKSNRARGCSSNKECRTSK